LATSLTKLKNAWDEFLMGLANEGVLKGAIDGLTKIMETINKTTEFISGGNGLIKSLVSLAGVLAALKGGKSLFSGTAIGGAIGGIVGKITGGKGEGVNKDSFFSVPEGFAPDETRGVGKAKRAELRANAKQRLKNTFDPRRTITKTTKDTVGALGRMELGLSEDDLSARAMGIRKLNEQLADG
jgi:hypothetical protein